MSVEPESSAPLVAALDLHKVYSLGRRSLEVLRGVSLELSPKSFVAIRGAGGAGSDVVDVIDLADFARVDTDPATPGTDSTIEAAEY